MISDFQKGDIVDVNLGAPPAEVKGHEQGFLRPCIIVKAFKNLKLAIILPVTSKNPKYALFTIVKLKSGTAGLNQDSYVLCHQIRTVSFDRILKKRKRLIERDIYKIHSPLIEVLEL